MQSPLLIDSKDALHEVWNGQAVTTDHILTWALAYPERVEPILSAYIADYPAISADIIAVIFGWRQADFTYKAKGRLVELLMPALVDAIEDHAEEMYSCVVNDEKHLDDLERGRAIRELAR